MAKVLFATDIHGNIDAFERIWTTAAEEEVYAIILGGDILPNPGMSPSGQIDFVTSYLWPRVDTFHLSQPSTKVYTILGNLDTLATESLFFEMMERDLMYYVHKKSMQFDENLKIIGYNYIPISPFSAKDWEKPDYPGQSNSFSSVLLTTKDGKRFYGTFEQDVVPRGTIEDELKEMEKEIVPEKTILITHSPPYNTKVDILYDGTHIGSRGVRKLIENTQPLLSLHGHIHESHRMSGHIYDKIGKTICINPGDSKTEFRGVVFDTANVEKTIRWLYRG